MRSAQNFVVMHVVEAFSGGVGSSIASICQDMGTGIDSVVVYGQREPSRQLMAQLAHVRFTPWMVHREIGVTDIRALKELRQILREINPDVVHLHSSKAGAIGRIACWLEQRKSIYTPHAYAFLRQDVSVFTRWVYRTIERVLSILGMTVACGLEEFALARSLSRDVALVPNSIDLEIFSSDQRQITRGVLAVGRFSPQKDFDFFCKVAACLPQISFHWVAGESIAGVVCPSNVHLYGIVSSLELASLMRKSSVFLNTSLWEGLSRAVLEACAVGMPLVLRDVSGNRDLPSLGAHATLFTSIEECCQQVTKALELACDQRVIHDNVEIAKRFFGPQGASYEVLYRAYAFSLKHS